MSCGCSNVQAGGKYSRRRRSKGGFYSQGQTGTPNQYQGSNMMGTPSQVQPGFTSQTQGYLSNVRRQGEGFLSNLFGTKSNPVEQSQYQQGQPSQSKSWSFFGGKSRKGGKHRRGKKSHKARKTRRHRKY